MARARIGWLVIACEKTKWLDRKTAAERWGGETARACGRDHFLMRRAENWDGLMTFPPARRWFRHDLDRQ